MVKNNKEKIYELKIDDNDEISGIDSISLVDEPAIEVNWVSFKKEQQDFHIPDGEDDNYLEQLLPYGQSEQELLEEGYEIEKIEYVNQEDFITSAPNKPSDLDTNLFKIRYKYVLNPKAKGPSVIDTTRKFCKDLVSKDLVFRLEDMLEQRNDFGQSFADWRGGYNCRHLFAKIIYKKKDKITGGARGRKIEGYDILGDTQNDTRTKNPSFAKEEMSKVEPMMIHGTSIFEHGEDENNKKDIENGIKDSNLTEDGKKFAEKIGKHIKDGKISHIITSPVKRAKDTAKIIADIANQHISGPHKVKVVINPHLSTFDIGSYEGSQYGSFDEAFWAKNPHLVAPNGESFDTFIKRMEKCYEMVKNASPNHYVITHSKVMRALKCLHQTDGKWKDHTTDDFLNTKKGKEAEDYAFGGVTSFDYDGTLSTPEGMRKAKQLKAQGHHIIIVTGRDKSDGAPVYKAADVLGIPHNDVHFTHGQPKSQILKDNHVLKHYDNDPNVIDEIVKNAPGIDAEKFDYNVGSIGGYVDPGITKKKKSSYLDEFGYLFEKEERYAFAQDEEKHIVLGPAMIPDQKIYRRDNQGNPYFVFFTSETIKQIADKYMRNKYLDNNDMMHDGEAVPDVFVIESWIKESNNDKSTDYGFKKLPIGTWFVSMKINNPEIWKMVKNHELNGFSVSGFFEEVADFCKEEMFLNKVAEILKTIKDE